jgi:polysaccharide export outer membrane protein
MRILAVLAALALAGCQSGGPSTSSILSGSSVTRALNTDFDYTVIEPDIMVAAQISAAQRTSTIMDFIAKGNSSPVVIGAGDVLNISIVSTSEGGFIDFSQSSVSPISTTDLPPQVVGSDGNVNVPPVGRVNARGLSVQQFERFLTRRLGEVLIEPSVIVQLSDRRSSSVSILGQVNDPGVYPINQNNNHLVEMLAVAGGPIGRSGNVSVLMSRGGRSAEVELRDLYTNPAYNVHMRGGDIVSLELIERSFTFLGAGGRNDTIEFATPSISLTEALGDAGGLLNRRADRKGVFVFRNEARSIVENIGVSVPQEAGALVPVVYRFDMSKPSALFIAGKFNIIDGDLVYVSDSLVENINAVFGAATTVVPAPVEYIRAETVPLQN